MSDKPKLDLDTAVRVAEQVVEGREDFVYLEPNSYRGCVYVQNDEPSCLVGHMLFNVGVPIEELHQFDNLTHPDIDESESSSARVVVPKLFDVDEKTLEFVSVLQHKQDAGHSWGESLAAAKEIVAEMESAK